VHLYELVIDRMARIFSVHGEFGRKAAVLPYNFSVRPDPESNSRPTSIEVDAFTTRPRSGGINQTFA